MRGGVGVLGVLVAAVTLVVQAGGSVNATTELATADEGPIPIW